MRKRWTGLATTVTLVTSLLALNNALTPARAADPAGQAWTLYAAGDVASPNSGGDEQNAALIKAGIAADPDHTRVAMLGDGAYPDGSIGTYNAEYGKADGWGPFKDKTFPVPGNHDYGQKMGPSNDGYRTYWNDVLTKMEAAGGQTLSDQTGWYSTDVGPTWHLIALNWACSNNPGSGGSMSGCSPTDPQGQWLAGDLAKATAAKKHIIAMWHGARFFSQNDNAGNGSPVGPSSDHAKTNGYWKMLQDAGADLVLAGHHHNYERFDHMSVTQPAGATVGDSQGQVDPTGPASFVVGTGGGELSHFTTWPTATGSLKRIDGQFGVLKLVLHADSYEYQFISSDGSTVLDESPAGGVATLAAFGGGSPDGTSGGTSGGTTAPTAPGQTGGTTGPTTPPTGGPASGERSGYWMVGADGKVFGFGTAQHHGDAGITPGTDAVDLEPTPTGGGYWVVDSGGGVASLGDAVYRGGPDSLTLKPGEKVTSLSSTPVGKGYWMFTDRGRVLPYGDAVSYGDMSKEKLNAPVLDSIVTPSGRGYYMVAADGGIFSFGDAKFFGSMGGRKLNAPVQSLVPDSDGAGYWLVASDGGIFAFDAGFKGSMGAQKLNKPVTGMVRYADGYLMVAEDGGIFDFSSKPFLGSLGDKRLARPIVSVAALG